MRARPFAALGPAAFLALLLSAPLGEGCVAQLHSPAKATRNFPRTWDETAADGSAPPTTAVMVATPPAATAATVAPEKVSRWSRRGKVAAAAQQGDATAQAGQPVAAVAPQPPQAAPQVAQAGPARPEAGAGQTLAVLEFKDKLPKEGERLDVSYVSDVVRNAAKDTLPGLHVITRENLIVLLKSTGRRLEDCEGECEVDTGRRVGADLVISGEILRFGSRFKVNMKLHSTREGELLSGSIASASTADELDTELGAAVAKLLAPLVR
jgi:TolB-like protein